MGNIIISYHPSKTFVFTERRYDWLTTDFIADLEMDANTTERMGTDMDDVNIWSQYRSPLHK
jgi:hypothetical protein